MGRYVARRLLETIPLMIIISIVVFMFIHLIPGDPAKTLAGVEASLEEVEALREELGLKDPLIVQYFNWVKNALSGDLGRSFKSNLPVTELIWSRFQFTIRLVFAGLVWAPFAGIFIGVMCAIKRGTWVDLGGMLFAICGLSAPGFWLGLMGIQFFSVKLGWLPSGGLESWKHLILPSMVMGTGIMATLARYSRSSMLETLREDYVRTARAKGLSKVKLIFRHALGNALIPVLTVIGLGLGNLLGGMVLVETIFGWPGVGQYAYQSVLSADYPAIIGVALLIALNYMVINTVVDILYGIIDPRVRCS